MVVSSKIIVWAGLCLLGLGAYFPWVITNPAYEYIHLVKIAGMGSGTETYGLVTLVLAVIAALGILIEIRWISSEAFRTVVGTVSVVLSSGFFFTQYGVTGMFIAGTGMYLTLIGGIVLLMGSGKSFLYSQRMSSPRGLCFFQSDCGESADQ